MQRWEQFNKICNSNDSLQTQINGIVAEEIKASPNIDLTTLIPHVSNWLKEEVENVAVMSQYDTVVEQ